MHHHKHTHYIHFLAKNKELREMYLAMSLKAFALSMIGIFVPVFLVQKLGFSIFEVAIFFLVHTLTYIFFTPFSGKIASRFGLKKATIAAIPLFILFYLGIYNAETIMWNVNYFAVLLGITESLFWLPFAVHFVRSSDKKHRSEEVGFLFSSAILSAISGPLIGGLLLTFYGFGVLFTVVVMFLFLSIFPMMFTKDYHEKSTFHLKHVVDLSKKGSFNLMASGSNFISEGVFWPIFLFSVFGAYVKLGLIFALAELAAAFSAFYFGFKIENKNPKSFIRPGAGLVSASWMFRAFLKNPLFLGFMTVLGSFAHMMVLVPLNTLQFNKASKKKLLVEYFVHREFMISLGKLIVLAVLAVFLNYKAPLIITSALMFFHIFG